MIYTYAYLNHDIEGFHKELCSFFEKLFLHDIGDYDETILCNPEFVECINSSSVRIKNKLEEITKVYHSLTPGQKRKMQDVFSINTTDIERMCQDTTLKPVKFDKLIIKQELRTLIKEFQVSLWENYPLNDTIKAKYKVVQNHFNEFIQLEGNKGRICPFCGLYPLSPPTNKPEDKNRDAYDHIAAESLYPFVSVNFRNLAPICTKCNSDEKRREDIFYRKKGNSEVRREVLYPYDRTYESEKLSITINPKELYDSEKYSTLLSFTDWDIMIKYAKKEEDFLRTWDEVYHIKDRYQRYLKQYESTWFEILKKKYSREMKKGSSFDKFRDEAIEESKDEILITPLGILRYVYYNYLLSLDSLKDYLESND